MLTNSIDSYEMINRLKNIFNRNPSVDFSIPSDFEPELRQNLNKLQQEYNEKYYQLKLIKSYNEDIDSYSKEMTEHRMRLESIGLFENKTQPIFVNENHCPLCHSEIKQNIPKISSIQYSLKRLDKNLENAGRDKINADKQYEHLEKEIKLKDGEIKIIQSNLYKIAKEKKLKNDFFKKLEIEQGNIKEFIGRVKEFFETNQPTENIESLNEKQKLLEQELKTFKSKIAQFDSILAHKLDEFNEQITLFASEIGLSHQGRYLFSLDNIDITVRDENHPRPISMKSIGGLNTVFSV